ncbi:MAG: hypothetical protein C0519_07485 [Hyphomicrobium sp.]|nr:hypothetical protein [Hyphomicrobium sp.]
MRTVFHPHDARDIWERGQQLALLLSPGAYPDDYRPSCGAHAAALAFAAEGHVGVFSRVARLVDEGRTDDAVAVLREAYAVVRDIDNVLWTATRPDEDELRALYRAAGHAPKQAAIDAQRYRSSDEGFRLGIELRRALAAKKKRAA